MKKSTHLILSIVTFLIIIITACNTNTKTIEITPNTHIESNIKMYSETWDEIINKGKLDMFNETNFTNDLVLHEGTIDIVGIDSAKAYYANFLTGFSNISFTINDIFGQDEKIVKYWNFKGTHTGDFFGIPATGKSVSLDGATIVRMQDGKIAEERDFMDNLDLMQQLGIIQKE